MKKSKNLNGLIALLAIFLGSCGLNPKSESSCKSTLTDNYWCQTEDGEAKPERGAWTFNDNGTFIYRSAHRSDGGEYTGKWSLGDVVETSPKLSMRYVNISFDKNNEYASVIGMNCKLELEPTLETGGRNYFTISGRSIAEGAMFLQFGKNE